MHEAARWYRMAVSRLTIDEQAGPSFAVVVEAVPQCRKDEGKIDGADQPGLQQHFWSGLGMEGASLLPLECVFSARRDVRGEGLDSVLISRKSTTIDPAYSHTPTPTSRMRAARRQIYPAQNPHARPADLCRQSLYTIHAYAQRSGWRLEMSQTAKGSIRTALHGTHVTSPPAEGHAYCTMAMCFLLLPRGTYLHCRLSREDT